MAGFARFGKEVGWWYCPPRVFLTLVCSSLSSTQGSKAMGGQILPQVPIPKLFHYSKQIEPRREKENQSSS